MFIVSFFFESGSELSIYSDDPGLSVMEAQRLFGKSSIKRIGVVKDITISPEQVEIGFPRREVLESIKCR